MSSRHVPSRWRSTVVALAAIGLVAAACGADDATVEDDPVSDLGAEDDAGDPDDDTAGTDADDPDTDAQEEPEAAADGAPVLTVADSPLGEHLVDGDGNTLYLFTDDSEGTSACTEGCLEAWPALTVEGEPEVGDGVDGSLVGTFEREDDGSTQVTYDGMPLYTFASDAAPGDVNGQGSGDVWFVVSPDGDAIMDEPESAGSGY